MEPKMLRISLMTLLSFGAVSCAQAGPIPVAKEAEVVKIQAEVVQTEIKPGLKSDGKPERTPTSFLEPEKPQLGALHLSDAIRQLLDTKSYKPENAQDQNEFDRAKQFVALRRRHLGNRQVQQFNQACQRADSRSVFCDFLFDATHEKKKQKKVQDREHRLEAFRTSELLTGTNFQADLRGLKTVSDSSFHRALKLFPQWELLDPLAQFLTKPKDCAINETESLESFPGLITSLGQKVEEFLPDPKYKALAIALYKKADQCGGSSDWAFKARYRLSLLLIWDGNCKEADPILSRVMQQKERDFESRALYWRSSCAELAGNPVLSQSLRSQLLKDHPMSFHGILLSGQSNTELSKGLHDGDPWVFTRSFKALQLNGLVRGAEMLQKLNAPELSLRLLKAVEDQIEETEPEFRLYLALLLRKSGNMIGQFKALSSAFKGKPELVSKNTLQLYYPLGRFDVLTRYTSKADPYLIAALIRQESGFNERAKSSAGALGLMQLMPKTARRMERVSRRELLDAKTNIRLGIKYFTGLLNQFQSDAELALAAYNAGPEKVEEWQKRYPVSNRVLFLDLIPFTETRNYVALISRNYYWYMNLYGDARSFARYQANKQLISIEKSLLLTHVKGM